VADALFDHNQATMQNLLPTILRYLTAWEYSQAYLCFR